MKRLISLIIIMVLLVSLFSAVTAFAGVSISGPSSVQPGGTYTYNVTVSYTASSIGGQVTCGGIFSGSKATFWKDSSSGMNASLTATASITVSVSSSAQPGDTGTISVSGAGATFDGETVGEFGIGGSKSASVAATPDPTARPTARPTRDPNATPRPTEAPSVWQLAANDLATMPAGGTVTVTKPENTLMPIELLSELMDKGGTMTIDFGTHICIIDGSDLAAIPEGISELDLGLSMDIDEALSAAADGQDVYQLHFNHEGQFPCPFSFKFKAEDSSPGDTVYLYYYYGTADVIEGQASATVDAEGYVTFDIYHCSSYFVSDTVIAGSINSFDADSDAQIMDLTNTLSEKEAALVQAQADNDALKAQLDAAQKEAVPDAEDTDADKEVPTAASAASMPLYVLITAGVGIALLTMLLTMLFGRFGIFKKKSKEPKAEKEPKPKKEKRPKAEKEPKPKKEKKPKAEKEPKPKKERAGKSRKAGAEKEPIPPPPFKQPLFEKPPANLPPKE